MEKSFLVAVVCFLFLHEDLFSMESREINDFSRSTAVRVTPIEEISVEHSDLEGNVNKDIYDVVLRSAEEDIPDEKSVADFVAERGHPLNFDINYLCLNDLDLTSLEGLPPYLSSRHLILSRNKIRDFRFLPSMPNLIKLEAVGNLMTDLSGLQNAPNLEILNLAGNPLKNLDTLPILPRLTNLYACYNNLKDLSGLRNVPNLMMLILWGCQMQKLTGMPEEFRYLGELNLSYNQLQNLEGMPKAPNLKAFMIEGNPITTLVGMPELPAVESLIILYNRNLKNLEGLPADLPQLWNLYLTHNGLESLHGLPRSLPKLKFLDLSYNSLTNLNGLAVDLPCLQILDLSGNLLTGLDDLPAMPKLETLKLCGNPISKEALIKVQWKNFPNLEQITGINDDTGEVLRKIKFEIGYLPKSYGF